MTAEVAQAPDQQVLKEEGARKRQVGGELGSDFYQGAEEYAPGNFSG